MTSLITSSVEEITGGSAERTARRTIEEPPRTVEPTRAEFEALRDDCTAFREDLLHRYQEPYPTFWSQRGLNE